MLIRFTADAGQPDAGQPVASATKKKSPGYPPAQPTNTYTGYPPYGFRPPYQTPAQTSATAPVRTTQPVRTPVKPSKPAAKRPGTGPNLGDNKPKPAQPLTTRAASGPNMGDGQPRRISASASNPYTSARQPAAPATPKAPVQTPMGVKFGGGVGPNIGGEPTIAKPSSQFRPDLGDGTPTKKAANPAASNPFTTLRTSENWGTPANPQPSTPVFQDLSKINWNDGPQYSNDKAPGGSYQTNPKNMSYDDYINAWKNKDWKTTEAYATALRKGSIPEPTVTQAQRDRFADANMDVAPQWGKEAVAGAWGVLNGSTLNLMDFMRSHGLKFNNPSDQRTAALLDRFKKEAPNGYQTGNAIGQTFPMLATGGLLEAPAAARVAGKLIGDSVLRAGATVGLAGSIPVAIADINAGKSLRDTVKDTAFAIGFGGALGASGRMLGDVLPQAGTIAYQNLVNHGGIFAKAAPYIAKIARGFNPEAAEDIESFRLGSEEGSRYNRNIGILQPDKVRTSQSSVNGLDDMINSMKTSGWVGSPVDVVKMEDAGFTSLDNTRVAAAKDVGIKVYANMHSADELLPESFVERFTTKKGMPKTWGDAVKLRIGKQNTTYRNENPYGAYNYNFKRKEP